MAPAYGPGLPDPAGRQDLRVLAALAAMHDSATTSALDSHRVLATHVWAALRTLGFDRGRVLVHGEDPATFLGAPHTTGLGPGTLAATIGPTHRPGTPVHASTRIEATERFDVVIAALPYADVRLTHPAHQARRVAAHTALTLASLTLTRPGGLTVVLAGHDLLDHPDPAARREMARTADLAGAVRLPGGIHRNLPGTDYPIDLLLLRRTDPYTDPGVDAGRRTAGPAFTDVVPVVVDGHLLAINTYFDQRPDHMLGRSGADPTTVPAEVTVTSDRRYFAVDLSTALDDITDTARRARITYTPRTPPTSLSGRGAAIRRRDAGRAGLGADAGTIGVDSHGPGDHAPGIELW